ASLDQSGVLALVFGTFFLLLAAGSGFRGGIWGEGYTEIRQGKDGVDLPQMAWSERYFIATILNLRRRDQPSRQPSA
ncbi:MAG: hypothetical protein ACREFH_07920, partial [Stellaceae bacterium]